MQGVDGTVSCELMRGSREKNLMFLLIILETLKWNIFENSFQKSSVWKRKRRNKAKNEKWDYVRAVGYRQRQRVKFFLKMTISRATPKNWVNLIFSLKFKEFTRVLNVHRVLWKFFEDLEIILRWDYKESLITFDRLESFLIKQWLTKENNAICLR